MENSGKVQEQLAQVKEEYNENVKTCASDKQQFELKKQQLEDAIKKETLSCSELSANYKTLLL